MNVVIFSPLEELVGKLQLEDVEFDSPVALSWSTRGMACIFCSGSIPAW